MNDQIEYDPITGEELEMGCIMRGCPDEHGECIPSANCPGCDQARRIRIWRQKLKDEEFIREWFDDVRYEDGAVRIRHKDFANGEWEIKFAGILYGRAGDNCSCHIVPINPKQDEARDWEYAVQETRNYLFDIREAMNEKRLIEEVLRERKSKGIHELTDCTPIGKLIRRQKSIIYHKGKVLKKKVTEEELNKVFGAGRYRRVG